jgi:hypothetical protein
MSGVHGAVRGAEAALRRVPWMCALDTGPVREEKSGSGKGAGDE